MLNIEKFKEELLYECQYDTQDFGDIVFTMMRDKMIDFDKYGYTRENSGGVAQKQSIVKWLSAEYVAPVLSNDEKVYIKSVIKPFAESVMYISKQEDTATGYEYIQIEMKNNGGICKLPNFEKGSMYKDMKLNERYTLDEAFR